MKHISSWILGLAFVIAPQLALSDKFDGELGKKESAYDIILKAGSEMNVRGMKILCEGAPANAGPKANCTCETYSVYYRKPGNISRSSFLMFRLKIVPFANPAAVSSSDGFYTESDCDQARQNHALCKI